MDAKKKLMQILDKPVFPEGKGPLEAVTDYLLENDVVPVVRCKDCKFYKENDGSWVEGVVICTCQEMRDESYGVYPDDFCSYGERRDTCD